jgi:hypothetical protein
VFVFVCGPRSNINPIITIYDGITVSIPISSSSLTLHKLYNALSCSDVKVNDVIARIEVIDLRVTCHRTRIAYVSWY